MPHTDKSHTFSKHDASWVWALGFAQLISWGSVFYAFALLLDPVEQALGLSRAESSLAFSLMLLAEGLLAFHVGRWIDRGHERWVMTGGSLLLAAALGWHTQVHNLLGFYVAWALMGVGLAGTLYPPAFAVLTRRFPQHFRRAIIVLTFLGGLASTVFMPLVAWLIHSLGWRGALWVLAAMHLLICAPLHWQLLRRAPKQPMLDTSHQRQAFAMLIRHPRFGWLALFVVLLMGVTSALPAHMVSLLRESGMQETWVVVVPAAIGVLQVVGRLGLYVSERRVSVHVTNRWLPALIPLGFAVLLMSQGHGWWGALFVVLYGVGNGTLTIVKGTVMAQYVSREHMGSLNGLLGVPMALARAAAPWVMGLMWSADAGYTSGLGLMLVLGVVGVAALWQAQRQRH